jgi:hypothetical protein
MREVAEKSWKQDALERIGYDVQRSRSAPGRFIWVAPTGQSEEDFEAPDAAWLHAWKDAASQAQAIHRVTADDWAQLSQVEQTELVVLLGDTD